ncbi:MAG TPA: HAMP domain-containing sensor histidine kinase [Solirubrobacteraceae bacterium]
MIRRVSVRWRLVAWVTAVLLAGAAVVFVVVYENTGSELRGQIDHDVTGDASQLAQAMRTVGSDQPAKLYAAALHYLRSQPFTGASSLLFIDVPGQGTASNHPEVFGDSRPDDGESAADQQRENALGQRLLSAPLGLNTADVPDVGHVRFDQRLVSLSGITLRVGAGEPLVIVKRAQHSVARSFLIAGAIALLLALLASYLAGASVSLPLRRMARIAARVDEGDLQPRMHPPASAGSEMLILAEAFNHMLDRLSTAFDAQRDFLADASHELRTPLTVIAGQIEVLAAQDEPDPVEVKRVQRLISAEVARTSRLVDDMLLLVRSERGDFLQVQDIDLRAFIEDLWYAVGTTATRHFELENIASGTLTADPDRLAQALRNLIRNAIEHTAEPGGLVRMEVQSRPGGRVRFTVIDDGPGIPVEHRERVFERFHRTDDGRARVAGGTGLGLPIVRAIAEAHGGSVHIVPSETGGAVLRLELPGLLTAAAHRRPMRSGARD